MTQEEKVREHFVSEKEKSDALDALDQRAFTVAVGTSDATAVDGDKALDDLEQSLKERKLI